MSAARRYTYIEQRDGARKKEEGKIEYLATWTAAWLGAFYVNYYKAKGIIKVPKMGIGQRNSVSCDLPPYLQKRRDVWGMGYMQNWLDDLLNIIYNSMMLNIMNTPAEAFDT